MRALGSVGPAPARYDPGMPHWPAIWTWNPGGGWLVTPACVDGQPADPFTFTVPWTPVGFPFPPVPPERDVPDALWWE